MRTPIIGLAGKKRSGKDTVADYLSAEYGFVRVAFADPLKEALLALDPVIKYGHDEEADVYELQRLSELIDPDASKSIRDRFEPIKDLPEVRRLLQRYGVTIREISEGFWVDAAMLTIDQHYEENGPDVPGYVIPDVRFVNEAVAIEDNYDGYVYRVERADLVSTDEHVSETALDKWDFYGRIVNGGSLSDLYADVDRALAQLAEDEYMPKFTKIRETA